MDFPKKIRDLVGEQPYERNEVGMSSSDVLIFPDYVLKIQKQSAETDNEPAIVAWLNGCLPVPEIPAYEVENGTAYTLMSKVRGRMLCDAELMRDPQRVMDLAAEGLKRLWSVDIYDCPCRVSRLEERLKAARYRVENGLVDTEDAEPETYGSNGFRDPMELVQWLEANRPAEDLVLTHGDYCLPNIFEENGSISGLIDLGKMGPADRWQDVAICLRSLKANFSGGFGGPVVFPEFEPSMLLERLGIPMNVEKMRYYILLDELC